MNELENKPRKSALIRTPLMRIVTIVGVLLVTTLVIAACVTQVRPDSADTDAPADVAPAAESNGDTTAEDTADESAADSAESPDVAEIDMSGAVALPSDENYNGIPVGWTDDGFPYRGEPDAPIVVIEYSDYGCPFCGRYFVQTEPAINEAFVRTGDVRVVFHDFPIASLHPNAPAAHEASLCVAAQGSAEMYWTMHAEIFRAVEEWSNTAEPRVVLEGLAEEVGADMETYASCMESGDLAAVVSTRVNAAADRGFSGTPSFQVVRLDDNAAFQIVGAQPFDQFAATFEAALAGEMPAVAQANDGAGAQAEEGIPFWATSEGWQPDPERPGYNMAGDQYRGDPNAPLTVIEFSDFQCPYCKRHTENTQPVLDEQYVDTGDVLWVYKHFPLSIHAQAPAAGVAAECAAEQGSFWEMHTLLFSNPQNWSINDPLPIFEEYAGELELDTEAFTTCMKNPAIQARVDEDMAAGAQYVRGTPTFIIIRGDSGSIIPGALPAESFIEVLDGELEQAGVN